MAVSAVMPPAGWCISNGYRLFCQYIIQGRGRSEAAALPGGMKIMVDTGKSFY